MTMAQHITRVNKALCVGGDTVGVTAELCVAFVEEWNSTVQVNARNYIIQIAVTRFQKRSWTAYLVMKVIILL